MTFLIVIALIGFGIFVYFFLVPNLDLKSRLEYYKSDETNPYWCLIKEYSRKPGIILNLYSKPTQSNEDFFGELTEYRQNTNILKFELLKHTNLDFYDLPIEIRKGAFDSFNFDPSKFWDLIKKDVEFYFNMLDSKKFTVDLVRELESFKNRKALESIGFNKNIQQDIENFTIINDRTLPYIRDSNDCEPYELMLYHIYKEIKVAVMRYGDFINNNPGIVDQANFEAAINFLTDSIGLSKSFAASYIFNIFKLIKSGEYQPD